MYITQRKKEKIWKIIHITSYVLNGLFLLLLLIGLCGCSSSNNNDELHKQRTINTIQRKLYLKEDTEVWNGIENYLIRNNGSYYFYQPYYESSYFYDFISFLTGLTPSNTPQYYYLNNTDYNNTIVGNYYYNEGSFVVGAIFVNGVLNEQYMRFDIRPTTVTSTTYYHETDRRYFSNQDIYTYYSYIFRGTSSNRYYFPGYFVLSGFSSSQQAYLDNYIDSLAPSDSGGSSGDSVSNAEQTNIIDLTSNFNPLFIYSNQLYQSGLLAIGPSNIVSDPLLLTGLTFKSNDIIFNQIKITYLSLNGVNFSFDNGATILNTSDYSVYAGYIFPLLVQYQNIDDDYSVSVWQTPLDFKGNDNYYNISTKIWTNNVYQKLEIINDDETIIFRNMTTRQLLNIQGSVDNTIIGGYSPFTLFSSAFTSITSILNISILPGITIGLLLFMPLLVVIITLIFKLVKK